MLAIFTLAPMVTLWTLFSALGTAQTREAQVLDLCTVVTNWEQYSGTRVRIKATLGEGAEQSVLYDRSCRNGEPLVFVSPAPHVDGNKRKLRRLLKKWGSATVVVEGTFRGPELAPIDPKLPEGLKDKLKGLRLTYGHLGSLRMMIDLTKVLDSSRED